MALVRLHWQRKLRDCVLGLEGHHAERRRDTGPSVTCHGWTHFGKLLIYPNMNKLRLSRENHTGKQLQVCSVCFLQTDLGSSSSLGQWWAAALCLEELTSLRPHPQAHKMAIPELQKIGLKQAWEITFPLFGFITILYLFFPTGIFGLFYLFFSAHDGDSKAALDTQFQCFSTLSVKIKSLSSCGNALCHQQSAILDMDIGLFFSSL